MTMAQQPLLEVSLAVTHEDLLSSLSWAAVTRVDMPVEETEPLKPPLLGGSGKGKLQPFYSCRFPLVHLPLDTHNQSISCVHS